MTYLDIAFETLTVNRQGRIIDREQLRTQQFVEALTNDIILEPIAIPGGAFLIGKHPITQTQWAAVMGPVLQVPRSDESPG